MEKILLEELEKYRLLSSYNPKLTLTENAEIFEAGYSPTATAREVETALGKDLQTVMRDYKIKGMSVGDVTKLLELDAAKFEKEMLKSFDADLKAGFPKGGTMGPAGKNMSKIDLFRRMASDAKAKGPNQALSVTEIDNLIRDISSENKIKWTGHEPKLPKPRKPKDPTDIVTEFPVVKKWDWKRLTKWGLGVGVGIGTLYAIYKMTHDDEPPTITGSTEQDCVQNPNQAKCKKNFVWDENCTIYKIGCKSDVIAKVQGCIGGGLVADGKFGKKTSAKLKELGYTTFTDADVDKICKTQPVVDPDSEDIEEKDPTQL